MFTAVNLGAGNTLILFLTNQATGGNFVNREVYSVSDDQGNNWQPVADVFAPGANAAQATMFYAQNIKGGVTTLTLHIQSGDETSVGFSFFAYEVTNLSGFSGLRVRGIFTITGRTFAVADNIFAEILGNGTKINWGGVANDGQPVSMAASPQQLLLASAGTAYIFDLMANTLTAIPGATFSGQVAQCAICDDFFLITIKNTKTFYVSAPLNASDWVTNGSAIVSVFPDNIVSMKVVHRTVFFASDTRSVWYYDSGNIFPFDVIQGADIDNGSAAEFSPSLVDNTLIWLGRDERGQGIVWEANGYVPQRISNHAIEFAIQGYARIDDAISYTYQDQGHSFYVLYFPTPSVTWVYDTLTGMWHQRGFWVEAIGQFRAHHSQCHTFNFNKHLVGDWQSSKVYEMRIPTLTGTTWTFADDDGNPIRRLRRAPHISKEQKRQYYSELTVFVETGLGPQPPLLDGAGKPRGPIMTMRMSNDSGHTWTDGLDRDCGQSGQFKKRVRWLRLGEARDKVFEISMSDPIGWRIVDGYVEFSAGTN